MKQFTLRRRRLMSVLVSLAVTATTMSGSWLIPASASEEDAGGNAARIGTQEYPTLQAAITDAGSGAEITLLRDTAENLNSEGKSYTLNLGGFTLTPADETQSIYTINGGTVVINGSEETRGTITGADASGNGGAISATGGANVTLNNINVTENKAQNGGGIYLNGSSLTLENTAVSKNTETDSDGRGGGIYATGSSSVNLKKGASLTENACSGGYSSASAIYLYNSALTTDELTEADGYIDITGNKSSESAGNYQGALYVDSSTVTLNRVRMSDNVNTYGVAVAYVRTSAFSATDCEFKNNISGDGALYFMVNDESGEKKVTFNNCIISGNTSKANGTVRADRTNITFDGCRIENNKVEQSLNNSLFGAGALELCSSYSTRPTSAKLTNTIITGNTGNKTGGIAVIYDDSSYWAVAENVSLEIDENSAVYGNTAIYGYDPYEPYVGYANDLWLSLYMKRLKVPAADSMKDPDNPEAEFTGFKWIDNLGGTYDALDVNTFVKDNPYNKNVFCLTAGNPNRNIAQPEGGTPYSSITDAIKNSAETDGVKKIKLVVGDDGWGTNVTEDVTITNSEKVEIDLNGRSVKGKTANAFTVNSGTLTLTNTDDIKKGSVTTISNDSTLNINSGVSVDSVVQSMIGTLNVSGGAEIENITNKLMSTVNVSDGARIENIDHSSSGAVTLSGKVYVGNVTLGNGKSLTVGENFSLIDNMTITLDEGVRDKLNGTGADPGPVMLIKGTGINDSVLDKITIKGANSNVEIKITDSGVIAQRLVQKGVYIDGASGSDTNTGLTPDTAVQTFGKAIKAFNDLADKTDAVIYVLNTIKVTGTEEWDMTELADCRLLRDPSFTSGPMVEVSGTGTTLTLSNIILDGYREQRVAAKGAIINVKDGATLIINGGTVLTNNINDKNIYNDFSYGGAVYAKNATVEMNGGTISNNTAWHGGGIAVDGDNATLTLSGGEINGNSADQWSDAGENDDSGGGGIAIIDGASAEIKGGKIINNTAADGGGIIVGGKTAETLGDSETPETLVINGGEINGNTAEYCGGGIYVQSSAKADINECQIKNNISVGRANSKFSGGGIYVNGERTVNRTTYPDGVLRMNGSTAITGNASGTNDSKGGGYAGCGTSTTYMYTTNGAAIYGNTAYKRADEPYKSDFYASTELVTGPGQPLKVTMKYTISGYMYDGTPYKWVNAETDEPVEYSGYLTSGGQSNFYTEAAPDEESTPEIVISGNTGGQNGGGIGNNGTVYFGTRDVTAEIKGTKTLKGRPWKDGDEFTFTLEEITEAAEGTEIPDKIEPRTVTVTKPDSENSDTASFDFGVMTFTEPYTHKYKVTETSTDGNGITTDKSVYTVTAVITDDEGVTLSYAQTAESENNAGDIAFENIYSSTGTLALSGAKVLTGRTLKADEFSFTLTETTEGADLTETVKNKADGTFEFSEINYTLDDVGEHTYTVSEVKGSEENITYSEDVYAVNVTVADNGDGTLNITKAVTKNGETADEIKFTNTYEAPAPPPTASPEVSPEVSPSVSPEVSPSVSPEVSPEVSPSVSPEVSPTVSPEVSPSVSPEVSPTVSPEVSPTASPSASPTVTPTAKPSGSTHATGGFKPASPLTPAAPTQQSSTSPAATAAPNQTPSVSPAATAAPNQTPSASPAATAASNQTSPNPAAPTVTSNPSASAPTVTSSPSAPAPTQAPASQAQPTQAPLVTAPTQAPSALEPAAPAETPAPADSELIPPRWEQGPAENNTPKTGDDNMPALWITLSVLFAAGALISIYKLSKKRDE